MGTSSASDKKAQIARLKREIEKKQEYIKGTQGEIARMKRCSNSYNPEGHKKEIANWRKEIADLRKDITKLRSR